MTDYPIFIVGYLHSGTTLLRNIFKDHPAIFTGGGETRFFDYLPMIRRNFSDLTDDQILNDYLLYLARIIRTNYGKVHIERMVKCAPSFAEFGLSKAASDALFTAAQAQRHHAKLFALVADALCVANGKTRWLEKTPTHLFHIDAILEAVPTARFVAIVRDPRDVLASKRSRQVAEWIEQTNAARREAKKIQAGFDPLWDALAWRSAVNAVQAAQVQHPEQVLAIRYEDLVTDQAATIKRICAFVDLPYNAEMLDVAWTNSTTQQQGQRGISAASVGKWQKKLTPAMVTLAQTVAKKEMQYLHYQLAPTTWSARLMMPLLLGRSGYEFFERLGRRWRMGGFSFVRNVLENYWIRFTNMSGSAQRVQKK
jgi:omega-hydroxy-beta-dihydromenaquinone-9 sulfotransferase